MPGGNDLEGRITRVFAESLNLRVPSPGTDLFETGALDSMAFVELLVEIEREFGVVVSLDDIELDNFRSIERIAGFVAARLGSGGSGEATGAAGEARVSGRSTG